MNKVPLLCIPWEIDVRFLKFEYYILDKTLTVDNEASIKSI